jgi:hypothetical protein
MRRMTDTTWRTSLVLASLAIADAVTLVRLFPRWPELATDLTAPHGWVARVGADRAAATVGSAALWCLALWLGIGLAALLVTTVPGRTGHRAAQIARRVLPAALLRVVAGLAGLSVLIAPVAAGAKAARQVPGTASAGRAMALQAPGWPTDPGAVPRARVGWPTDEPPTAHPPATPARLPTPSPPTAPAPRAHNDDHSGGADVRPEPPAPDNSVLVRPGDSLWLIAARRLGPDASEAAIAQAWPRWYAANAQAIGTDPSLIRPGEVLAPPV